MAAIDAPTARISFVVRRLVFILFLVVNSFAIEEVSIWTKEDKENILTLSFVSLY